MDDDTATIETNDAEAIEAPEPSPSVRRRPSTAAMVIGILVALVLAEAVLLFRGNTDARARTEVLQTATGFLSALTSYNSSTIDRQRARVLSLATGKFRQDYTQVTSPAFINTLRQTQADQKGTVVRVAVASVQGDSATVLAMVRTSTTNKDLKAPRVEQNVIELSLVHTKNGWKIDAVSILGALTS
jgi:Mce-associated membrane protein